MTQYGGTANFGTIYKLAPGGTETILNNFVTSKHGGWVPSPCAGLILDQSGNLYGTASKGGTKRTWPGVVFKFTP